MVGSERGRDDFLDFITEILLFFFPENSSAVSGSTVGKGDHQLMRPRRNFAQRRTSKTDGSRERTETVFGMRWMRRRAIVGGPDRS